MRLSIGIITLFFVVCQSAGAAVTVEKSETDDRLRVEIGGELFTEYIFKGHTKPILYPVIGPHGIGMTRNFPMKKVDGEERDHVHHQSLWYVHGDVNGHDFWHAKGKTRIEHDEIDSIEDKDGTQVVTAKNKWFGTDGKLVCTDTTVLGFSEADGARAIDFQVTIHASEGDLTFGDTKEGTMAIRTHPQLRVTGKPNAGVKANGKAINSEGDRDAALWGKHAKWVDYHGEVDGKMVGIAIFDHPSNPRHPTTWHARTYGLVAANPFGYSYFKKQPRGSGNMVIKKGESVTFRYRFVFHAGKPEEAKIADRYESFAASASIGE